MQRPFRSKFAPLVISALVGCGPMATAAAQQEPAQRNPAPSAPTAPIAPTARQEPTAKQEPTPKQEPGEPPSGQDPAKPDPRPPVDVEAEQLGGMVRELTLEDALRIGRTHNVRLQAASLLPEQARLDILAAEGAFEPELYASTTYAENASPQRNQFQPSVSRTSIDAALGWRQRVVTGGLFDLAFRPARFETSGSTAFPDRQFTSEWVASYRQPLLRNAWTDYNLAPANAARFGYQRAKSTFEQTVQDTLLQIVEAYWELVYARENWQVVLSALDVAEEQLRITDARIAVQELAPRDRIADQAEVARRREELIVVENGIRRREDVLRTLLFDGAEATMWRTNLRPASPIEIDDSVPLPDLDECLDRALQERPELRSQRSAIAQAEVNQLEAERTVLPELDLVGAWSSDGARDDFSSAVTDSTSLEYPDWSISLEFSMPLGNHVARSRRQQARLEVERQRRELHASSQRITTEVRDAIRNLGSLRQSIRASAESVQLGESNLDTERAKLRVGASTNFEVQRRNQELREGRTRHLRNLLDYRIAESRLLHVQGVLQAPQS